MATRGREISIELQQHICDKYTAGPIKATPNINIAFHHDSALRKSKTPILFS